MSGGDGSVLYGMDNDPCCCPPCPRWCSNASEEYENIVTGDGSVVYMSHDPATPVAIFADNPYAKIVFALR